MSAAYTPVSRPLAAGSPGARYGFFNSFSGASGPPLFQRGARGDFGVSRSRQISLTLCGPFIEQRFGVLEVACPKPFGKPAVGLL